MSRQNRREEMRPRRRASGLPVFCVFALVSVLAASTAGGQVPSPFEALPTSPDALGKLPLPVPKKLPEVPAPPKDGTKGGKAAAAADPVKNIEKIVAPVVAKVADNPFLKICWERKTDAGEVEYIAFSPDGVVWEWRATPPLVRTGTWKEFAGPLLKTSAGTWKIATNGAAITKIANTANSKDVEVETFYLPAPAPSPEVAGTHWVGAADKKRTLDFHASGRVSREDKKFSGAFYNLGGGLYGVLENCKKRALYKISDDWQKIEQRWGEKEQSFWLRERDGYVAETPEVAAPAVPAVPAVPNANASGAATGAPAAAPAVPAVPKIRHALVGTKWKFTVGGKTPARNAIGSAAKTPVVNTLEFLDNGTLVHTTGGRKITAKWKIMRENAVLCTDNFTIYSLSDNRKTLRQVTDGRESFWEELPADEAAMLAAVAAEKKKPTAQTAANQPAKTGKSAKPAAKKSAYQPPYGAKIVRPSRGIEPSPLDLTVWRSNHLSPKQVAEYIRIPASKVVANPNADKFPGAVDKEAPRLVKSVNYSSRDSGMHCTGLYAPAGELITIRVDPNRLKFVKSVRIGCHTDDLTRKVPWKRFPRIVRDFEIKEEITFVSNAFGGLIYITTTGGGKDLDFISVTVTGAVEAPYFRINKTSALDWERSRASPAPWGDIEARGIRVTVPSSHLRTLKNPNELLRVWERIVMEADWLAAAGSRSEWVVTDIDIIIGDLHSGFPVMAKLGSSAGAVSYDDLTRNGNWGFFHEFGHNRQKKEWTFEGYGEVTCNLFALYCMEKIAGKPVTSRLQPKTKESAAEAVGKGVVAMLPSPSTASTTGATGSGAKDEKSRKNARFRQFYAETVGKYFSKEGTTSLNKLLEKAINAHGGDGDKLSIYIPVIRDFGWLPLRNTFADYQKEPATDPDIIRLRRRDQRFFGDRIDVTSYDDMCKETFVRVWSKHCRANLAPYFERMGFPVSGMTMVLCKKWRPYMPKEALDEDEAPTP
ncbi:MAG: M60 family metallopeptidase [Puniceicoccales bacterium]|nr:M60 family metallopeptidase [Puniceicoccales bacterium]